MNILITGGTGYFGSRLIHSAPLKYKFFVLYRSKKTLNKSFPIKLKNVSFVKIQYNLNFFKRVIINYKIKMIIHCATNYGRTFKDPSAIIESNLSLPLALLNVGSSLGIEAFINTDTILDRRIGYYSLSKSQFVDWLHFYKNKTRILNIRLDHFYGENSDPSTFFSYIFNEIKNNANKIYLTKGEQERDFIYIDDVITAFCKIIANYKKFNLGFHNIDVGLGDPHPIKEIAILIAKKLNYDLNKLKFGALEYRDNEIMKSKANITILKKLGWKPKYNLKTGINRAISKEMS